MGPTMKSFFFILPLTLIVLMPFMARAEVEMRECGAPPPAEMETNPGGHYCNPYNRRSAYKAEDDKFRKLLKERQKNFAAPSNKAAADFNSGMNSQWGFNDNGSESSANADAAAENLFGPPDSAFDESGLNP